MNAPTTALMSYLDREDAVARVCDYRERFTGRAFDDLTRSDPNAIEWADYVAVAMLAIEIRPGSKSGISPEAILRLDGRRSEINRLLQQIPTDIELHSLTRRELDGLLLDPKSPGRRLFEVLKEELPGQRVARSKLLARKRPGLIPIRDTVVERALGLKKDAYWEPWWTMLQERAVAKRLIRIRTGAKALDLTLLRIADIVVWHAASEQRIEG